MTTDAAIVEPVAAGWESWDDAAAAPSRVPANITIHLVLLHLGRHDAAYGLVACPIGGCRADAFEYGASSFHCSGCGAGGDALDLARQMGLGSDTDAFLRALSETLLGRDRPCNPILLRGLRLALAHRNALREVERARCEREAHAAAVRRAYGERVAS